MLRPLETLLAVSFVLLGSAPSPTAVGADLAWPGWRGPGRDGRVSEFQPPSSWPEQLKPVWHRDVGTGYSSPLVSGGYVFQQARQGDEEVVWCLDLATGQVKWRQSYATPFRIGGGGEKHGKGPKSSPVLADGRLFTLSITGLLSAWDMATGKPLWTAELGSRFGKSQPYWGVSTSPLIDEDRVIVHFGNDESGALIALDARSGEEVWSHGEDGPSYSSPIVVEIGGVRQVIEWNHRAVVGVESESGRFLWEYELPHDGSDQNMPTPVIHDGGVILGAENRGIRSIEPQRENGKWTVTENWHQGEVALDMSSAVMDGELLYGFSHYDSGRIFCLDPRTGEIRWQGPPRTGENVAFLSIPGYIVALINDGKLQIIKADSDRYESVATYPVSQVETWAPPVLLRDGILVKDEQSLRRFSF